MKPRRDPLLVVDGKDEFAVYAAPVGHVLAQRLDTRG